MANIGIYYGSTTGTTQNLAEQIAKLLNVANGDLHDVSSAKADFSAYDTILFGSSTFGSGDLQDDWESFIDDVKAGDLAGKKVALFGCGDSSSYGDSFCDALGLIYNEIKDKGITIIGKTSTDGYSFDSSEAVIDGQFIGLVIDEDNESDLTDARVNEWVETLKSEI